LLVGSIFTIFYISGKKYVKCDSLFTNAEIKFLTALDLSVGRNFRIFGKVMVSDVIQLTGSNNRKSWQVDFNKIAMKHFDFVICDKQSFSVLAVIELDDSSHNRSDRKTRDSFINDICGIACLPIIRIKASGFYNYDDIANIVYSVCGSPKHSKKPSSQNKPISPAPLTRSLTSGKTCKGCNKPMVLRSFDSGTGSYWDCSSFPPCKVNS